MNNGIKHIKSPSLEYQVLGPRLKAVGEVKFINCVSWLICRLDNIGNGGIPSPVAPFTNMV